VAHGKGVGHGLSGGNSPEGGGVRGEAATMASGGDVPAAVGARSCNTGVGRRR
jgi:hypothetical protein